MSTQEKVIGNWNQVKGRIKQRWGQITDDELQEAEGNLEQLIGLVQQKTGEGRQQIERILSKLGEDAGGAFTHATEAARQYAGQATEALRSATDQLRTRGREGYEEAQRIVRRRPAETVAIAFGTGLVIGLVIGMMASSRNS